MAREDVSTNNDLSHEDDMDFRLGPILLAVGIAVSAVMPVFLTGTLAVQIRHDLKLTPSLLGAAVAIFFGFAALFSYLAGRISYKVDGAKVVKVSLIASSLVLLGIATLAHSYGVFIILLAVSGVINGSLQPSINLYLSHVIPPGRQGFAFGVKQAAVPVATLLAGLAVPAIALTVGWRYAYMGIAPLGVILYFFVPQSILPEGGKKSANTTSERPPAAPILMLAIAMGLGTGAANAFGAFFVTFVVHSGWKPGAAGLLSVVGSFIGASARVGHGLLADRRVGKHFLVAMWSTAIGGLGYLLFAFGASRLIIPAMVVSYGAAWGWNGLFIFGVVRNFTKYAGYATGTVQSGAYVGSVVGPLGFGLLVEHGGYPIAWLIAACAAFSASIAIIVGRALTFRAQPDAVG